MEAFWGWTRMMTKTVCAATILAIAATGCSQQKPPADARANPAKHRTRGMNNAMTPDYNHKSPTQPLASRQVTWGKSLEGRPITGEVIGNGPETVLIMATIHGNEYAGTPLVARLSQHLQRYPHLAAGRRVVLMPIVNPDGYHHRVRYNASGVDLNRNFPADNFAATSQHGSAPLSEPESRVIFDVLEKYSPSRIVSIHQPLNCLDYDGPGDDLAESMGRWTALPVKQLGSRPGSLGSYVGLTMGVPIITMELRKGDEKKSDDALWSEYGQSLLAAVRFPEALPAR